MEMNKYINTLLTELIEMLDEKEELGKNKEKEEKEKEPIMAYGYIDNSTSIGKAKEKVVTYILDSYKADSGRYTEKERIALAQVIAKVLNELAD